jgi:hypothetical protein
MGELLLDYRKSSPDLVTNIRTLGGVRNKEYMAALVEGRKKIETFVRVMRNFAFVKTPSSLPGAPEVVNAVVEAAPIEPVESDISPDRGAWPCLMALMLPACLCYKQA